jgi:hypothetical protein
MRHYMPDLNAMKLGYILVQMDTDLVYISINPKSNSCWSTVLMILNQANNKQSSYNIIFNKIIPFLANGVLRILGDICANIKFCIDEITLDLQRQDVQI